MKTKPFIGSIERVTEQNDAFRRVISTAPQLQLVVMTLMPGEEVGLETHADTDQFIRIEQGRALAIVGNDAVSIRAGDALLIPAGTPHNVVNRSSRPVRFYTLYSNREHAPNTVERRPPLRRRARTR